MTSPPIIFPYPNPLSLPPALLPHHVPADPRLLYRPHPHQGLGSGANQPNVITQSVTWSASKKGVTAKPTTTIETDCPTEDFVIDSPDKSMRLVHPSRPRCRPESECELDTKLRRLVEILDGLQAREGDSTTYSRRTRSSRTRRPRWWRKYHEDEEDEDYPLKDEEYACSAEELPERRKRPRKRMQRICDCEEPEEELEPFPTRKRVPMVPKMDWIVLKKVPKKGSRRYARDEEDRRRDYSLETGMRDVLYVPPCDKEKYRKRSDPEFDR